MQIKDRNAKILYKATKIIERCSNYESDVKLVVWVGQEIVQEVEEDNKNMIKKKRLN